MASATKKCRVCGKDYKACRSNKRDIGVFRWQEVSCSPECGAIYLKRINESRGIIDAQQEDSTDKVASVPVVEFFTFPSIVDGEAWLEDADIIDDEDDVEIEDDDDDIDGEYIIINDVLKDGFLSEG